MDASTAVPLPEIQADAWASDLRGSAAGFTECMPAQFAMGIVPAGTELHPPFSAVLTDLSPATGGTGQQGEVGLDGIHGHRIEKTIDLQLELHDATEQIPDYPVLVQLNLSGTAHGTLLVDGGALRCDAVARMWHQRTAGGVPIPDPTLRYELGKWAQLVGVIPDPPSPGGVKPVWGSTEHLHLRAQAKLPDNQESDPLMTAYGVHPEPGKPDAFYCRENDGGLCGDVFRFWPGYGDWYGLYDAYLVVDRYSNFVFGLTDADETQPSGCVEVDFTSQLTTVGRPHGFTLDVDWSACSSQPSGTTPVTVSVAYPQDPDNDWGAGTVSKDITLDFQAGESRMLIQKQHYDARFDVDDGIMPMTVAPEADEGSLPKIGDKETPRLVLLAVRGTDVPSSIISGSDEPSPEPQEVYRSQSGTWHKVSEPSWDVVLDTTAGGAFRLSLIDGSFKVIPETAFRVHFCPRQEHLTEETPDPEPCTLGPVDSDGTTGILPSLTLNAAGGQRGYLGIELTKAPVNPGTYYILVESTGTNPYRIRQGADLVRRAGEGSEYLGAYAICTVHGVKLLNEDLAPITKTLNMSLNRAVYLLEIDPDQEGDSYQSDVVLHNEDTEEDFTLSNVSFWRLGKTPSFLTGLITVVSPDPPLAPPAAAWNEGISMQLDARVQNTSPAGTLSPSRGRHSVQKRTTGEPVQVKRAATRLVEITAATPNFDAVTEGEGFADRRKIQADVRSGADGWVDLRLTNVDNPAIFTFDNWGEQALTTDLRAGGGKQVCPPKSSTRDMVLHLPESNDPPFRAVLRTEGETEVVVNPGLYRLVARYSDRPPGTGPVEPISYCDSDLPGQPLCLNEWVVSVGERVLLGVDPTEVLVHLGQDLEAVTPAGGTVELASAFLIRVASEVTQRYQAASANVVVKAGSSADPQPRPFLAGQPYPRPFLAHELRDELPPSGGLYPLPNYGQTNPDARFPLRDANLNLATTTNCGISRTLLYSGKSWGPSGQWVDHVPKQTGRNDPFCQSPGNPCPPEILFNRYVAVMAHETAHGFGVLTPKSYLTHGTPPVPATMQAFLTDFNQATHAYQESEASADNDQFHEPIRRPRGFGEWSPQANGWLMTWAPIRWNSAEPGDPGEYDFNPDPSNPAWQPSQWLVFERPLRFSLTEDYLQDYPPRTDQSIQRYFTERVPLCLLGRRDCR